MKVKELLDIPLKYETDKYVLSTREYIDVPADEFYKYYDSNIITIAGMGRAIGYVCIYCDGSGVLLDDEKLREKAKEWR